MILNFTIEYSLNAQTEYRLLMMQRIIAMVTYDYSKKTKDELEEIKNLRLKEYTSISTDMNDLSSLYSDGIHDKDTIIEMMKEKIERRSFIQRILDQVNFQLSTKP